MTLIITAIALAVAAAGGCLVGISLERRRTRFGTELHWGSISQLASGIARHVREGTEAAFVDRAGQALGGIHLSVERQPQDRPDGNAQHEAGLLRVPVRVLGTEVGAIWAHGASRHNARAVRDLAGLVSASLAETELHGARRGQTEAQLLALKTQIRPHFVYNALNVIASYTVTNPERARDLLVEFADFTRYLYSEHGTDALLRDELRAVESYLTLERARYGDRLTVHWQVSPESLSARVPHLCIQPLVENAVRHGTEAVEGLATLTISAHDEGPLTLITVEDDGVGMDPARLADVLDGRLDGVHLGIRNVDARLRQMYGNEFGLVVDTAPGAGTLVTVCVPRFAPPPAG